MGSHIQTPTRRCTHEPQVLKRDKADCSDEILPTLLEENLTAA